LSSLSCLNAAADRRDLVTCRVVLPLPRVRARMDGT